MNTLFRSGIVLLAATVVTAFGQQQPANMEDVMKAMQSMMGGNQSVQPVDFREIKALLPETAGGMDRTEASGEKNTAMGMTVAFAEGSYESGNESLTIRITDISAVGPMMRMAQFAWTQAEIDREGDSGFERTTTIHGHKAMETYDSRYKKGEVQIFVGERFIIEASGRNIVFEKVREAIDSIDINKLLALKPPEA